MVDYKTFSYLHLKYFIVYLLKFFFVLKWIEVAHDTSCSKIKFISTLFLETESN